MKVAELKELLAEMRDDDEVVISYPSGDYWRTEVAADISSVEVGFVIPSAYHGDGKFKVIDPDEAEDRRGSAARAYTKVILR